MKPISFAAIRNACRLVAERARYVHLQPERLADYVRSLPLEHITSPVYDAEHHFLGEAEATAAYLLTLDAVNFGSGYFPHLKKRPGMSGYFTVASHLKDYVEAHGPLSAVDLMKLTPTACSEIFGQDLDDQVRAELLALFTQALHDLGSYVHERFQDSFTRLIEAAGRSAERLASLLAEMPYFQDVADYEGLEVPFYKRAQITASDLSLAFKGEGLGSFDDLGRLTIFADNLVPHVLRVDGVLEYDEALAARISAGELIPAGSAEEIEIRAAALHAVERMVEALREDGQPVTAQQLDVLLWNRGQNARYKAVPRHRTRTVFY